MRLAGTTSGSVGAAIRRLVAIDDHDGATLDAREVDVEQAFGLEIPQTLEEACDPRKLAPLV